MLHRSKPDKERRQAYLREFNQLSAEQQRVHFLLALRKIASKLARAKVDEARGGITSQ